MCRILFLYFPFYVFCNGKCIQAHALSLNELAPYG